MARIQAVAAIEQSVTALGEWDRILLMRRDRLVREGWSPEGAERICMEYLIDVQRLALRHGFSGGPQ